MYLETNVRVGTPVLAPPWAAMIGGALIEAGHEVRALDLDLADVEGRRADAELARELAEFEPHIAGLSSITPTWHEMKRLAALVKEGRPETTVVCGGLHATLFTEETLSDGCVDFVIRGEADHALNEMLAGCAPEKVAGMAYMKDGAVEYAETRPLLEDLDKLPYPAWELFEIERYGMSHLTERRRPSAYIETSRGCPFGCIYCDKTIFGRRFRAKTPERVVAEIEVLTGKHGFRELHVIDDGFSTDLDRAKEICRLIVERRIDITFNLFNGVRGDRLDEELCALLKRAGCYQVAFGVESGNEAVLDGVSKGLTKEHIRRAVAMCGKHGLETFGFFMIALPQDTEETIDDTIRFAVDLNMTITKYDIAVPLPGTPMFEMLDARGLIKTRDWSRYIFHRTDTPLFEHPNLTWEQINRLYYLAYRRTYLRLRYIANRFVHGLRTGGLWYDAVYFLRSRWR